MIQKLPPQLPNLDNLSLAQLVAQMIVVRASGYLFDHQIQYPDWEPPRQKLQHWVQDLGVGGIIFLGGSAAELAVRTEELQSWSAIPLLMAADIEEGVGQRFSGATWFPPPMTLGAILRSNAKAIAPTNPTLALDYAYQMGAVIAQEAEAIGLNWVLAPVVDVNNNPDNPVINIRAFGEDVDTVTKLTRAFIKGSQGYPVLTTAKHFPGHGDTAVDSHLALPVLAHSPERLESLELEPFRGAIAAGVDTIMSAHLLIPSWDAQYPATLSPRILTGKLRQELGFEGLIVTDALIMGGITNSYGATEAPILAVEAGADILLMPVDPEGAIAAVVQAVTSGRISLTRIKQSVQRIWQAKQKIYASRLGLQEVNPAKPAIKTCLTTSLAQPSSFALVKSIIDDSLIVEGEVEQVAEIDLLRNNDIAQLNFCNFIYVDEAIDCDFLGRNTPAITIPQARGYKLQILDKNSSERLEIIDRKIDTDFPPQTLLQLFIRGNPFRGSAKATDKAQNLVKKMLQNGELQALIVYGSPYAYQQLRALLPKAIPSIFSYAQIPLAQAIALQALFQISSNHDPHNKHLGN